MGAIWGHTHPNREDLSREIANALAHRGTNPKVIRDASFGTLGHWAPHRPLGIGKVTGGVFSLDETRAIACCGYFTDIIDAKLSAEADVSSESFFRALVTRMENTGPDVFQKLSGAFVMVIRCGDQIHLVRDGAGARTIFYGKAGDGWAFGIEPKAIHQCSAFSKTLRPAALAQYLACSFVPGQGTMLENLWELPAGHLVTLQNRRDAKLQRWFRFEEHEGDQFGHPLTEQTIGTWASRFRETLEHAVATRISPGEPVGVFLSGGLDSSVITAELAKQVGGKNVKSWAIHFGPNFPNELEFARMVADRCGTDHREVQIDPKSFLPSLRKMIWHLDDPIGDPITQPNFELARIVSGEVACVFNGEGGDPCFGGPKNLPMLLQHWYGGVARPENFRELNYLQSYRRAYEEIEELLTADFRQEIDPARDLDAVFRPYFQTEKPQSFLNKLMTINIREKGAHLILPKVERMLAASRVTPLSPLFDERIITQSFQMPPHMKLHRGVEKFVMKKAYENDLPPVIIDRPKSGMRVPVHYWFQSEMKRFARKILHRRQLRKTGIFNPDRVKQLLNYDIEGGRGRYGLRLWMLITFELWRRIVLENEPVD